MNEEELELGYLQAHIDNYISFHKNLSSFLKYNPDIKIEHIITHKPYHITIIYKKINGIHS